MTVQQQVQQIFATLTAGCPAPAPLAIDVQVYMDRLNFSMRIECGTLSFMDRDEEI